MSPGILLQNMSLRKDRPQLERRKTTRGEEDNLREQAYQERARRLHSVLEFGQILGLDPPIHGMLLQIAQKACEVMDADRCRVFLLDL